MLFDAGISVGSDAAVVADEESSASMLATLGIGFVVLLEIDGSVGSEVAAVDGENMIPIFVSLRLVNTFLVDAGGSG